MAYRRRMASSPLALQRSLQRRLEKVEGVINKHWTSQSLALEEEGIDRRDLSDAGVDDHIDPALPSNAKSAQAESNSLKKFLTKLDALGNTDSKRDKFLAVLKAVTADGRSVLVFTEYADTLEYLRDLLRPTFGTMLGCYSGAGGHWWNGEKWVSVSKADITEKLFKKELQVLLCTDAASEGLNLQAASALINYDLPWNPSKVEQRIGRIDRIGQQQLNLPIRNLFLTDSVDMRVYQALRVRCGLFEHFVGRMQPVLALARDALRRNLRSKDAPSFIQDLELEVKRVSADGALANAFTESDAEKSHAVEPPVTRADLETVLGWSEQSKGSINVKKVKGQPRWRLTGLGKRAVEVAVYREILERDEKVEPFTVGSQIVQRMVERLGIPSRLPLIVAEHHAGSYQANEARWVHANGVTVVTSAKQLQQLIESWDGTPPSPKLILEAQEAARKIARPRVEEMRQTAAAIEHAGLQRQLESARARLLRELGRILRCIGSGDLNSLLRKQIERESRSDERYHRVLELLGGYPTWTADILQDAESFTTDMSVHDRQARVALPTPLDATLNDPRWKAMPSL